MLHHVLLFQVQLLEKTAWKLFFMAEEEHLELTRLRKSVRLTQEKMAERVGAKNVAQYKNWEYGKALVPKAILAKARAVAAGDPIREVGPPQGAITETEVPVPYIGRIAASSKVDWTNPLEADLTEFIPVHMALQRGIFCARVQGDSMTPMLQPEDIAVFRSVEFARIGSIVAYLHEDDQTVTIKQLKHDGTRPVLHPLNPEYEPEPATGRCLGILVGYKREIGKRVATDFDPEGLRPDFF
jgi:SOS-response transcriptional repressor LexA